MKRRPLICGYCTNNNHPLCARRHQLPCQCTCEAQRAVVAHLRRQGHSTTAIAGAVGVDQAIEQLMQLHKFTQPDRIVGQDGKSRPSTRRPTLEPSAEEPEPFCGCRLDRNRPSPTAA